ncbi:MAG: Uma2 family endonuclease [Bryobacter sp.]|nr:Uma2 family endonuclease [Bryobacter sp.]
MQVKTLLTAEEFLALPPDDERNLELDEGEIVELTKPGISHAVIGGRIARRLAEHVDDLGLGLVIPQEAAFRLNDGTVRAPDVAVVLGNRYEIQAAAYPGAPDIAIEVVSPHDWAAQVHRKRKQFLDAGAKEVWIVEPEIQAIEVYRADGTWQSFEVPQRLHSPLLPGWELDLAAIFP